MINFVMPDLYPASAEIFLLLMALVVLLADLFAGRRWLPYLLTQLTLAGALGMGLYPQPFTEVMHSSVNELLRHVALSKIQ